MVVATKADRTTQGQLQSSVLRLKESLRSEQILPLIRRERVRAELSFGRKSAPRPTNFNKHKLQPLHALLVLLSHS